MGAGGDAGAAAGACAVEPAALTFMVVASVMVMLMTPALAFFTAGLLRARSTLSVLTQTLLGFVVASLAYVVVGFSLVYGETLGGVIGSPAAYPLLAHVSDRACEPRVATHVPLAAVALFQLTFWSICPLLITGAYAERVTLRASLALTALWPIFVYAPVAHAVWNPDGWLRSMGVQDFAGGIVLHTTAGAAALVAAVVVGPRAGFAASAAGPGFRSSNLPIAASGAVGLWAGWFFFNAGSALAPSSVALSAALSTQLAASTCCAAFALFSGWLHPKPRLVDVLNGLIAGMAGITPASGFVGTRDTLLIAVLLSSSFFVAHALTHRLHIDDALEVTAIHGFTGAVGSLAVAFFADPRENAASAAGVFYGGSWRFVGVQLLGVVVSAAWSAAWTFAILHGLQRCGSVRIPPECEHDGLDLFDLGEFGYHGLRLRGAEPLFDDLLAELGDSSDDEHQQLSLNVTATVASRAERRALLRKVASVRE